MEKEKKSRTDLGRGKEKRKMEEKNWGNGQPRERIVVSSSFLEKEEK